MTRVFFQVRSWISCHPIWPILLVGLGVRLIGINSRDLQYDDAFSIFIAVRPLDQIISGTAADTMPPLYYFLLHYWMLAGQQVWFIRTLTVIISLISLFLLYRLVELWLGKWPAAFAALFSAVSPLLIFHAQDIRMYSLLVFGQIGYVLFFSRLWMAENRKGKKAFINWAAMVLFGLVAMYSHNLAIFALLVPNLFVVFHKRWRFLLQLMGAQLVIAVAALPWLVMVPGQLEKIQKAFWTPRPGLVEVIQAIVMFNGFLPLPGLLTAMIAILSVQILVLAGIAVWRFGRGHAGVSFLLFLFFVPPLLLFLVSYLMRPVFVPRGFLISAMAYYGLLGFAVSATWKQGLGKLLAGLYGLVIVLSLPYFYSFNSFPRSPAREAVAFLEQDVQPGDRIVHETKLSFFPSHFHGPALPQVFIMDEPGSANDTYAVASQQAMQLIPEPDLPSAVDDSQGIYFVTYSQVFEEYRQMGLAEHPAVHWLGERYHLVERKVFNDLEIYHFER